MFEPTGILNAVFNIITLFGAIRIFNLKYSETRGCVTFKARSTEDFMRGILNDVTYYSDFLYKNICCWYSFEVEAVQMSTHKICFYKEVINRTWAVI